MRSYSLFFNRPDEQKAADVFGVRLKERGVRVSGGGYPIRFSLDPTLEEDAFCIAGEGAGTRIAGGGRLGLLHGAGWYLRGMRFSKDGAEPCAYRGIQRPQCGVRGFYMASHFHNYYHVASLEEMARYLEDLALLGVNYLMLLYPLINLRETDTAEKEAELARHAALIRAAHGLGMRCCEFVSANWGFMDRPEALKAAPNWDPHIRKGDTGPTLCMAKEGAQALVDRANRFLCQGLKDCGVDMVISWPYDEGGCGCENCSPWGGNGFLKAAERAFAIAGEYFPSASRCVSTWVFDTPEAGEWKALEQRLDEGDFCEYVLADSHTDFPRYPLERRLDKKVKLLNFPEISMWGLFPWGGWGATMLPERFTRLYRQTQGLLSGGFPYSEGIYEDINVSVVERLYWNGDSDWTAVLREYASYEFGLNDPERFIRLVRLVEQTHTDAAEHGNADVEQAEEAYRLARGIDDLLPAWGKASWRWRQVYLRTMLDARRYRLAQQQKQKLQIGNEHGAQATDWTALLAGDEAVRAAFEELRKIYHCRRDSGDPYHARVSPLPL